MSASSDIRAAWKTAIFDSATIQAITTKAYAYDVLANIASVSEDSRLYFQQEINFFTYLVTRRAEMGSIRGTAGSVARYSHLVRVDYHIGKNIGETDQNYNLAIDSAESADDMVRSALGKTWSSTVDYFEQSDFRGPELITLDEREVWRVGYSYIGFKTV